MRSRFVSLVLTASLGAAASFGVSACTGGDGGDDDPAPDAPADAPDDDPDAPDGEPGGDPGGDPGEVPRIDGPAYVDPDAAVSGG